MKNKSNFQECFLIGDLVGGGRGWELFSRQNSWRNLSSEPHGSHPGPGTAGLRVPSTGHRCAVSMCMMNHTLGRSGPAALRQRSLSGESRAHSRGRRVQ